MVQAWQKKRNTSSAQVTYLKCRASSQTLQIQLHTDITPWQKHTLDDRIDHYHMPWSGVRAGRPICCVWDVRLRQHQRRCVSELHYGAALANPPDKTGTSQTPWFICPWCGLTFCPTWFAKCSSRSVKNERKVEVSLQKPLVTPCICLKMSIRDIHYSCGINWWRMVVAWNSEL